MQIELVFGVILGPGHFLKAIGFCMNELGILRNRLIGVTGDRREKKKKEEEGHTLRHGTSKSLHQVQQGITTSYSHMFIDEHQVPEERQTHSAVIQAWLPFCLFINIPSSLYFKK